jgi:hypothetical protein
MSTINEPNGDRNHKAGSLEYKTAGELMRAAIDEALRHKLTVLQWKVFVVVLAKTGTYSKASDGTSSRDIAAAVYGVDYNAVKSWQRENVTRALARLRELGVIGYEVGVGRVARTVVDIAAKRGSGDTRSDVNVGQFARKRGSVHRETWVSSRATPSNSPSNQYLEENGTEEKLDEVIARLRSSRFPSERETAEKLRKEGAERARLRRIIEQHPTAPSEMFASVALRQPTPYLENYRVPS